MQVKEPWSHHVFQDRFPKTFAETNSNATCSHLQHRDIQTNSSKPFKTSMPHAGFVWPISTGPVFFSVEQRSSSPFGASQVHLLRPFGWEPAQKTSSCFGTPSCFWKLSLEAKACLSLAVEKQLLNLVLEADGSSDDLPFEKSGGSTTIWGSYLCSCGSLQWRKHADALTCLKSRWTSNCLR